ncbi:MAG: rhodanese-like domain-containing protein [Ignavibacteriales bacterium]|nr:MAG: rhodanese-like domain-containing protein [Ignavibacteriales bacterium]
MQKKIILQIIIFSSLTGFVFNYFNPDGIGLIRSETERTWADSLEIGEPDSYKSIDSLKAHIDTIVVKTEGLKIDSTNDKRTVKKQFPIEDKGFDKPLAISIKQAYKFFNQGMPFIDARNREDFLRNHIPNSINIPFYQFEGYKGELKNIIETKPFVIYCNGKDCDMSDMLGDVLFEMGYKKIYLFVGGWEEWEAAKYPSSIPYEEM